MTHSVLYELFWVAILFSWLRYGRGFRRDHELRIPLQAGFLLKVAVGYLFLYIYGHFYAHSDAYTFLDDARILAQVFREDKKAYLSFLTGIGNTPELIAAHLQETHLWSKGPSTLINDSANVIRVNSLIWLISQGNAHIHVIFMAFFSLLGLREISLALKDRISLKPAMILGALILIPNVLFWTSGVLKEPFVVLGLGLLVSGLLRERSGRSRWLRIVSGLLLLLCFKPYLLGCLALSLGYVLFGKYVLRERPWLSLAAYAGILGLLVSIFPQGRNRLAENLTLKQRDSYNVGKGGVYAIRDSAEFYYFRYSDIGKLEIKDSTVTLKAPAYAERKWIYRSSSFEPFRAEPNNERWKLYLMLDSSQSLIRTTPIDNSFARLMLNVPEAFVNAMLRPFPSDPGSAFIYPSMLEMFLCVLFMALALIFHRKLSTQERRLAIALALFAAVLLVLIGWTTPVTGAIVRYRIPAYMAIFILSIFIIRIPEKWTQKIP